MLFKKQQEILKQIKNKSIVCAGTSTGKTLIALFYYFINYYPKPLLIFAPAAKVHEGGWSKELEKVSNILGLDKPNHLVVSYSNIKKENVPNDCFIILDEAHLIKNPTAIRSKAIREIIKKNNAPFIMLSATPGQKVEDYMNYFILWGISKNKTDFLKNFTIQELNTRYFGKQFIEVVDYKNKDYFNKILANNLTNRISVNDIAEMPPLIEKVVNFESCNEYKEAIKTRIYEIDGKIEPLDTQAKLCSVLRQIVNTKAKIEQLKYIAEECNASKENLLIFYNFNSELEEIEKAVKVDYVINGKVKEYPKKDEFDKQSQKITVVQIQAGGTGIELQYNSQVVFFSPTYSYQDYEQALGRAYRIGQKNKVVIHKFNTFKTIEEKVWNSLKDKKDFNERMWDVGKS